MYAGMTDGRKKHRGRTGTSSVVVVLVVLVVVVLSLPLAVEGACRRVDPAYFYRCPTSRYCEWEFYLSSTRFFLRNKLGYDGGEWNYEEGARSAVERTRYRRLPADVRSNLAAIGFAEESHDCCHNHYEDYRWVDLDERRHGDVLRALKTLGYHEQRWDGGWTSPYEVMSWSSLPEKVRKAANVLCHTSETWDGVPLHAWSLDTVLPGQSLVTPTPTERPTINPTERPTSSHTERPTPIPTERPTPIPTKRPTINPTKRPTISLTADAFALDDDYDYDRDVVVADDYDDDDDEDDRTANGHIVDVFYPTTNDTAADRFKSTSTDASEETIAPTTTPTTRSPTGIPTIRPTPEPTHDPTHNPTNDPTPKPTTHPTHNPTTRPTPNPTTHPTHNPTNDPTPKPTTHPTHNPTNDPTPKPTTHPTQTPTTRPTSSPTAPSFTSPPALASVQTSQPCRSSRTDTLHWCPVVRYCVWDHFPFVPTQQYLRQTLRYSMMRWNYIAPPLPGDTDVVSFSDHDEAVRAGLRGLGYDEDRHDCCNSHYSDYDWADFVHYARAEDYPHLLIALALYGYDETTWTNDVALPYDDYWWDDLPPDVQTAMFDVLCYNRELWNGVPLLAWDDATVVLPGSWPLSKHQAH